jgi:16S rRNA (uracil1498-N3)-methyltransferase
MATQLRAFVEISRPELGAEITLPESDSRHALQSLRLSIGDKIIVIDRNSRRTFSAEITATEKTVSVKIIQEIVEPHSASRLRGIIFGLSKGEKNDFVVEKATEIGAETIILFQSSHSVVRIDGARAAEKKLERWNKIAESAAQQSKRSSLPTILLALNEKELTALINNHASSDESKFICSLQAGAKKISEHQIPKSAWVAVGPEGDFSASEYDLFTAQGFNAVTLGPNVLRAETAAVVAMGVVQAGHN